LGRGESPSIANSSSVTQVPVARTPSAPSPTSYRADLGPPMGAAVQDVRSAPLPPTAAAFRRRQDQFLPVGAAPRPPRRGCKAAAKYFRTLLTWLHMNTTSAAAQSHQLQPTSPVRTRSARSASVAPSVCRHGYKKYSVCGRGGVLWEMALPPVGADGIQAQQWAARPPARAPPRWMCALSTEDRGDLEALQGHCCIRIPHAATPEFHQVHLLAGPGLQQQSATDNKRHRSLTTKVTSYSRGSRFRTLCRTLCSIPCAAWTPHQGAGAVRANASKTERLAGMRR